MKALYYESHVTIDPAPRTLVLEALVSKYGFKLAKLYMDKGDSVELFDMDMFMTGHGKDFKELHLRMNALLIALNSSLFTIRRYKIEAVVLDSRKYNSGK